MKIFIVAPEMKLDPQTFLFHPNILACIAKSLCNSHASGMVESVIRRGKEVQALACHQVTGRTGFGKRPLAAFVKCAYASALSHYATCVDFHDKHVRKKCRCGLHTACKPICDKYSNELIMLKD